MKWLDNLLSHNMVSGVHTGRQGVSRRLSVETILLLEIVLLLIQDFGIPIPHAITLAESLVRAEGRYRSRHGLSVEVGLAPLRENLLRRLETAVETAPIPTRGRPPANKTGRLV